MITLTEFLLARIAEDEAAARGVAEPLSNHDTFSVRFCSWESDHSRGDEAFVDRFNPARVLAECEAKRRIVGRCEQVERFVSNLEGSAPRVPQQAASVYRHRLELSGERSGLVLTASLLALSYADHPDYREEWKP